ncbi:TPA: hypothetical protein PWY77_002151 [Mannheimia haemolytica]|uniref:hypothetical protein n=1 Tax=Mannheimia haemolytica TaxID=75985 RepID=UPI0003019010|nr:hypothetical protein [Mannheimia haemolytica]MDW0573067.1 hypothetical protein [Mannheimia haemolytica]MDW0589068.1 hypothetical protein [Mannheimia haemolytica]MDW0652099.1 hypothetical protein [Mannheimia haemolytica]QEB41950.1 hypothetical protein BG544_11325 [Mannheimia haemolytica]QEB67044.1 hypothetical protein BG560_11370 [Mannheimia haemolytica]
MKWLLTHDSHELKKGDVYEGETLPLWLVGKAIEIEEKSFEVATPSDHADGETGETGQKGKKDKGK